MKTLKIYDPAMCCSSGVCGPDVDPVLVQLSGFLKNLDASAVKVERYNLSQEPAAYTTGPVAIALKEKGTAALPLVSCFDPESYSDKGSQYFASANHQPFDAQRSLTHLPQPQQYQKHMGRQ